MRRWPPTVPPSRPLPRGLRTDGRTGLREPAASRPRRLLGTCDPRGRFRAGRHPRLDGDREPVRAYGLYEEIALTERSVTDEPDRSRRGLAVPPADPRGMDRAWRRDARRARPARYGPRVANDLLDGRIRKSAPWMTGRSSPGIQTPWHRALWQKWSDGGEDLGCWPTHLYGFGASSWASMNAATSASSPPTGGTPCWTSGQLCELIARPVQRTRRGRVSWTCQCGAYSQAFTRGVDGLRSCRSPSADVLPMGQAPVEFLEEIEQGLSRAVALQHLPSRHLLRCRGGKQ